MIATAIRVAAAAGLGGVAGLFGGLFGVGGGFLVIPVLGFFYGMDQQTAQGTVLVMVVPKCSVGIFALSATLRRRCAHGGDHRRIGFDCDLSDSPFGNRPRPACPTARLRAIVGVIGGCFSGFFGVGGAFVAPPLLTTFFGLRQLEAQGLALALVSPSALIALLDYAEAGRVDWLIGLPLAIGGTAAISAGVAFASRLPERRMRLAFCGLLLLTAVLLALRG